MLKIFQALKNIITSTKEISTTLLLNMWCVGYEGGDDAAQVSIVKDVSLLSARNRSRPRSTINLHRWRRKGISRDGRSTAAMRTRSCEGTARSCEPAAMVHPSEQKNNPFEEKSYIKFILVHRQIYAYNLKSSTIKG